MSESKLEHSVTFDDDLQSLSELLHPVQSFTSASLIAFCVGHIPKDVPQDDLWTFTTCVVNEFRPVRKPLSQEAVMTCGNKLLSIYGDRLRFLYDANGILNQTKLRAVAEVFTSPKRQCRCGLNTSSGALSNAMLVHIYSLSFGKQTATQYFRQCRCGGKHFYSFSIYEDKMVFYKDAEMTQYFQTGAGTVLHKSMLRYLDGSFEYTQSAFRALAQLLNYTFHPNVTCSSDKVYYDSLEKAYLRYISVDLLFFYNPNVTSVTVEHDLDLLLAQVRESVNPLFIDRWGNVHPLTCSKKDKGCGSVLVTDCTFKLKRSICMNRHVIETTSLGDVDMGCKKTPRYKSRFCSQECETKHSAINVEKKQSNSTNTHNTRSSIPDGYYLVEKVLDRRVVSKKKRRLGRRNTTSLKESDYEYKVHWTGYPDSDDSWVDYDSIGDDSLLDAFYRTAGLVDEVARWTSQRETVHTYKNECQTLKEDSTEVKNRTSAACATACYPCNVIVYIDEIFNAESCTQISLFLLDIVRKLKNPLKVLCYDDVCHLDPFIMKRRHVADMKILADIPSKRIDAFHFPNHVDPLCKIRYNPANEPMLNGVNTECCEEENKWLKRFKYSMRYMNRARYNIFALRIVHIHNIQKEKLHLAPV